jgi:hypothetical protein
VQRNDVDIREALPQGGAGSVAGSVVDDDDARLLGQRRQLGEGTPLAAGKRPV